MTAPDTNAIREAITEHWGPRCGTLDTEDFPELVALGEGRCPACRAWEQLDALCDALDELRAENERLTKERDEARAQVAAAYEAATSICADQFAAHMTAAIYGYPDNSRAREAAAAMAERLLHSIRALTPDDASAALKAYGREKVREGMQHMLNRLQHEGHINRSLTYADAIEWAKNILADMEKLK